MPLRKPAAPPLEEAVRVDELGEWGGRFPTVWEFLACRVWEDGSARVPGSLTLFADDGRWKACVNDKGGCLVAFVSGTTPTALFEALEAGLSQGGLDWRRSRSARPAGGGKRS